MEKDVQPTQLEQLITGELTRLPIADIGRDQEGEALSYQDLHERKLNALAAEVEALPTIIDKATLQVNQDQLTKLVKTRTGINDWRLAFFKPWRELKEKVDAYLGTNPDSGLQARIKAMEAPIEAKKKVYLDEQERKRQEELRKVEEKNAARRKQMLARGMGFDGTTFTFEQFTALAEQVYAAPDETFAKVLTKLDALVAAKAQREADELAAKKKRDEEQAAEAARLKAENDRLEADRRKFEEERAAFNRQKEEREAKERGDRRLDHLVRMGLIKDIPAGLMRLVVNEGDEATGAGRETLDWSIGEIVAANEKEWSRMVFAMEEATAISEERRAAAASIDAIDTEAAAPVPVEEPAAAWSEPYTEEFKGAAAIEIPMEIAPQPVVIEEVDSPLVTSPSVGVVGDQPIIENGVVSMPEPASDDESELELIRSVFGVAEQLQIAIAKCGWELRNTNNRVFMHGIYRVHAENTLSALAGSIGVEVKPVHELIQ